MSSSVKSMKTSAAPCPGIHNPNSLSPLHCFRNSFRPFAGPLFNPAVSEDALIPEFASSFCLVYLALQGNATFHKMDSYRYLEDAPCTVEEIFSQTDFSPQDISTSVNSSHLVLASYVLEKELAVSLLWHSYFYRAGNCLGLLSYAVRWLAIANILLVLCERDVVPSDSTCLRNGLPMLPPPAGIRRANA